MKQVMKSLLVLTLFFLAQGASASIVINEIMYDLEGTDTDREWIEVYNNSNEDVDLSGYKLFEAGVNHGLVLDTGDASVPSSGYAVIVTNPTKFKTDWPNFAGSIFDSSFSLSNEGESLAIKNSDLELSDEYTYTSTAGGAGDGKSLQKVSGSWTAANPTPGASNAVTSIQNDSSTDITSQGNAESENDRGSSTSSATSSVSTKKVTTKVAYSDLIFSNIPASFEATTLGINGEKLIYGKYIWNFGDGVSLESKAIDSIPINHTYYYPNDYVLTLEYYSTEYLWKPDATFQVVVKVIPASVYISNVGNADDFFVELTNNSKYDVNVSNWRIVYGNQYFVLPKNTIVLKNQKISYSPKVTNFTYNESENFVLYNANSDLIFDYNKNIKPSPELKKVAKKIPAPTERENPSSVYNLNKNKSSIPESLTARGYAGFPQGNNKNFFVYGSGLLLLLGISGSGVYFIRKGRRLSKDDDFEVFDE